MTQASGVPNHSHGPTREHRRPPLCVGLTFSDAGRQRPPPLAASRRAWRGVPWPHFCAHPCCVLAAGGPALTQTECQSQQNSFLLCNAARFPERSVSGSARVHPAHASTTRYIVAYEFCTPVRSSRMPCPPPRARPGSAAGTFARNLAGRSLLVLVPLCPSIRVRVVSHQGLSPC